MPDNNLILMLGAVSGLLLVAFFLQFLRARKQLTLLQTQRERIIRLEAEAEASAHYGETFKDAARASVMAVGQELSSKLLDDHKREAESVKTSLAEKAQAQEQKLMKQFAELAQTVAAIGEVNKQTQNKADTLWRTMASPAAAGALTEIALENLLRKFGLQKGVDFDVQVNLTSADGANFRPDAIVYLPHDRLMVMDCKASKFELELANAADELTRKRADENFAKSMNTHIDALARKGYTATVVESWYKRHGHGRDATPPQIINVMYIASDAAVERLNRHESGFREKMLKHGILAVGPSGLHGLCTIAAMEVAERKRDANREEIIRQIERLLAGFSITFDHLEKTGTHLKRAAESFSKFTASYNRTFAPRLRAMEGLGIAPEGGKKLPATLPAFELREASQWIEGEAEAVEFSTLEDKRRAG